MSRAQTLAKARAEGRRKLKTKTPSRAAPFLTGNKLTAVLSVLLAAATIAFYSPVLGYSFVVLDDRDYVVANPHIHGGLSWSTMKWAFTSTAAANWHPLTWLSHALDYQLFALDPAGHHLHSVLIHALNAVLLFLLLAWVTKRVGPSLLVAALFALHPINVESVAWVAERKNVLSTLFFLLAIGAYAWYSQKPDWRRYLLVAGLFAAGLMAKPMVITLPFVLMLLDYWPLGRTAGSPASTIGAPQVTTSRLLLEKIPLLVLSAASAWITLFAQRTGHAVRTFEEFPLAVRIENAVVAYGLYLWKTIWPARLALYPYSASALPAWQWTLSGLVLISITALVIAFRSQRYLLVGWFWFLGTLVPVIGLVQVGETSMADRYAYIPLIGIFIMIAWSLDDWAEARKVRTAWRAIPALCALLALGYATSRQMSYWQSQYDLWAHSLAVAESSLAHNAVGAALIDPSLKMASNDPANLDTAQKRMDDARRHFERSLELCRSQQNFGSCAPDMAKALTYLGFLDLRQSRPDQGRQHFEEALKIYRPLAQDQDKYLADLAELLNNLGNLDGSQNRLEDAGEHFAGALRIYRPLAQQDQDKYVADLADTLKSLGLVDQLQNRIDQSRAHYTEALTIYRKLAQGDPARYADDIAKTEASLQELDKKVHSH
jgi:tetratricopeptide (TPR) repeat protein